MDCDAQGTNDDKVKAIAPAGADFLLCYSSPEGTGEILCLWQKK